ncbi:MAG: type IV pilus biogenesis/stability protein PilW [Burkholderiales bacterium]|nr:type IV pilus biogenesis/stability protein PilW [Burkholderiales bacterium]
MRRSIGRRMAVAAGALALAACAQQETKVETVNPTDPELVVIGERADARSRAKAHTDLAAAYYELGNMGVALEEIRYALAADANYAPAYNVQGLVYMDLKDTQAAQQSFNRALQLTPNDPDLLHNYGWYLCQTGRENESISLFMKAIAAPLYRAPSKSYAAAGQCTLRRASDSQQLAQAGEYFERALRLDPNNVTALLSYADLQYRRDRVRDAQQLLARFHKLVEPTAASLWLGIRIERRIGDRAAESAFATQLRRRYPNSDEYRDLLQGKFE